jgi:hypothetical protein
VAFLHLNNCGILCGISFTGFIFTIAYMNSWNRFVYSLPIVLSIIIAGCAGQTAVPTRSFEGTLTQTIHMQGLSELMMGKGAGHSSDSGSEADGKSGFSNLLGAAASNVTMKIYVREDKVAYDIDALGGFLKMRSIIDRSNRTLTVLLPTHQAMVENLRSIDTLRSKIDDSINAHQSAMDSLAAELPKPTGKKQTINGFDAEEYRGKMKGMDLEMWVTTDPRMKFYDVIRDAFLGRNRTGSGGLEQVFNLIAPISGGKVPVKTVITSDGKTLMSSELSNITEEKLDDAIFEIPKDYEIIKKDSVEKTMGMHTHYNSGSDSLKAPSAPDDSDDDGD